MQKKKSGDMESLVTRLEGRINRSLHQEAMICSMKNDQEYSQSEIRSSITNLKSMCNQTSEKAEGSVNHMDSSARGAPQTPHTGVSNGALFGNTSMDRGTYNGGDSGGGPGN